MVFAKSRKRICSSQQSMSKYYVQMNLMSHSQIYHSMLSDYYRLIITRWRLSNHRLNIETGRYTKPITIREHRVCTLCNVLEDERHVVFDCSRYDHIRTKYQHLVVDNNIQSFLNPTFVDMVDTANFIYDIERRRSDLNLWFRMVILVDGFFFCCDWITCDRVVIWISWIVIW